MNRFGRRIWGLAASVAVVAASCGGDGQEFSTEFGITPCGDRPVTGQVVEPGRLADINNKIKTIKGLSLPDTIVVVVSQELIDGVEVEPGVEYHEPDNFENFDVADFLCSIPDGNLRLMNQDPAIRAAEFATAALIYNAARSGDL